MQHPTPRRAHAVVLAALTTLAAAACGAGGAEPEAAAAPVTRDSAGIAVVENAAAAWTTGEGWRVEGEPAVEIGSVDGPAGYQLDQVRNAVRLGDGTLAVADGGSQRIRLYSDDGRHLRDMGGRGGGPGEFEYLAHIGRFRGDSIAAWDSRHRRLTVFDAEGRTGRVWTVEGVPGYFLRAYGWFDDGAVLVAPGMVPEELLTATPGERRPDTRFVRAHPGGSLDTLSTLPGREEVVFLGETFGTHAILFGRNSYAAVHGAEMVAGESGRFEVQWRTADGALRQLARVALPPRTVTPQDLAAARERQREEERKTREQLARMAPGAITEPGGARTQVPHRETHPYFDRLEVDAAGHVWLREPAVAGSAEPQRWQVLDREGRWLGAVETPGGLRITEIGEDYLLGVYEDEMEVQYVRMYRLARG